MELTTEGHQIENLVVEEFVILIFTVYVFGKGRTGKKQQDS
jgi:hypothetical protein